MSAPTERCDGMPMGHPRQMIGAGIGHVAFGFIAPTRNDALLRVREHKPARVQVHDSCVRELSGGARIVAGNAGDHPLVLQLLVETRQAALAEDFQSRLDEPNYRPSDRLLVRRDRALVAHVHVANHFAWFDGQRVPLAKLEDFVALPEFRHAGYDAELLESAETIAAGEGAVLALARTEDSTPYLRREWSPLRGQGHTRANARAVLAHLAAQNAARRRHRKQTLEVRTWRHFELDAIRAVYDDAAPSQWGPLLRTEDAWQWMVGRKAQDQILIAVEVEEASPEDSATDLLRAGGRVVGYAAVRGSCIAEMMSLGDFGAARTQLLARACQDAMDRDHHSISLYTPSSDPLHELLVTAGGRWIGDKGAGEPRWLAKLLAPEKWVDRFFPLWHGRARAADLERPIEIGFAVGAQRHRFTLTRRSSRLEACTVLPPWQVECSRSAFDSLLVGNLSVSAAIAAGVLRLSHGDLLKPLAAIFSPRLFWQSPLETMRL